MSRRKKDKRKGTIAVDHRVQPPRSGFLCVRGPIYGPSGYSRIVRGLIQGLDAADKRFWIDAIPWMIQPTIELPEKFREIIKSRMIRYDETSKTEGFLCVCLPSDLPGRPIGENTWNFTIFETTQVPDRWIQVLASSGPQDPDRTAIKGIIIPCQGNLVSFKAAPQKKVVIPLAIDYDVFNPDGPKAEMPYKSGFNILISYHQNPRKNPGLIYRVLNELDKDTTVYLKTYGIGMSSWERRGLAQFIREQTKAECRVVLLYDLVSDQLQAEMYRAMDLVLNVSHGEGWDLPRHEAYACGVPAIGPTFIGPADYVLPEFDIIKYRLVPCPELPPYFSSVQKWAEIDLLDVLTAINMVRESRAFYTGMALRQREHLIRHTGTLREMAEKVWNTVM